MLLNLYNTWANKGEASNCGWLWQCEKGEHLRKYYWFDIPFGKWDSYNKPYKKIQDEIQVSSHFWVHSSLYLLLNLNSVWQKELYKHHANNKQSSSYKQCPPHSFCLLHSLSWIQLEENYSSTTTGAADANHIETQLTWALVAMAICSCASAWMRNVTFHSLRDTHRLVERLHRSCACFGTMANKPMPNGCTPT